MVLPIDNSLLSKILNSIYIIKNAFTFASSFQLFLFSNGMENSRGISQKCSKSIGNEEKYR